MSQQFFLLTVKAIVEETEDTKTFVFKRSSYLEHYKAGQFITLMIPVGREVLYRSYSLCTSVYTDLLPAITIKRIPGGRVSNYLNDYLQVGDRLEVLPVAGRFVLPEDINQCYSAVFIAGGSGITPIFSMIKALLHMSSDTNVLLIYANRDEKNIIYAKCLQELQAKYALRMQIIQVLSKPSNQWRGLSGRLTGPMLNKLIDTNIHAKGITYYFLCGPEGLMNLAYVTLIERGIGDSHICRERFTISLTEQEVVPVASKLTIYYEGERYVCEMEAEQTLLDVALENGIDIPFSCNSGLCNTCRAKCVKGKVSMLEDEGLTEAEVDQGYVLTCVGRAASDEVVIEVE